MHYLNWSVVLPAFGLAPRRARWCPIAVRDQAQLKGAYGEVVGAGLAFNLTGLRHYHAFDFRKYGHRYLAEYQYRFNRRQDLKAILPRLLRAAALTPKRTQVWLHLPEYSC